jgi:hypothetical protein
MREKCKGGGHRGMDLLGGGVAPGNWKRPGPLGKAAG